MNFKQTIPPLFLYELTWENVKIPEINIFKQVLDFAEENQLELTLNYSLTGIEIRCYVHNKKDIHRIKMNLHEKIVEIDGMLGTKNYYLFNEWQREELAAALFFMDIN